MLGLGNQIESSARAGNLPGAYMLLNKPFGLSDGQAAFYREKLAREGRWATSQRALDKYVIESQTASSFLDSQNSLGFAEHVIGQARSNPYAETAAANVLRNLSWFRPMPEIVTLAGMVLSNSATYPVLAIEAAVGALKNVCHFPGPHISQTVTLLASPKTQNISVRTQFDGIRGIQDASMHSLDVVKTNPSVGALLSNPPTTQNEYYLETYKSVQTMLGFTN